APGSTRRSACLRRNKRPQSSIRREYNIAPSPARTLSASGFENPLRELASTTAFRALAQFGDQLRSFPGRPVPGRPEKLVPQLVSVPPTFAWLARSLPVSSAYGFR